jgi:hypothetical protein
MDNGNLNLTREECEVFAHNFASLMGIENMFTVWSQKVGQTVYVNLAPIQGGVIYYPDLIKVKINRILITVVGDKAYFKAQ